MKPRIGYISLGCARNLVDTEVALGVLKKAGYPLTDELEDCDIALVNTCCFIEDAKAESVDIIMRLIDLKKQEKIRHILVMGCLPERYKEDLAGELKEVDGFIGTNDYAGIDRIVGKIASGEKAREFRNRDFIYDEKMPRHSITPRHFRYIKISEGCAHRCSFCVIPKVKGRHRSRPIESILAEARYMLDVEKVSELDLVGQDTTSYGKDLYGQLCLDKLLQKLAKVSKRKSWLRLLYAHPNNLTDDMIKVIKESPVICKYIDIPIQHINDQVLEKMKRSTTKSRIISLIEKIRRQMPEAAIRTSLIVGFPGETQKQFDELKDFVRQVQFERLGVFVYSREEKTPAFGFSGQVPEKIKQQRLKEIMALQREVSEKNNARLMGRNIEVLVDEIDKQEQNIAVARTQYDAPEVDGIVYVRYKGKAPRPGQFLNVKVIDTLEYDLVAEL